MDILVFERCLQAPVRLEAARLSLDGKTDALVRIPAKSNISLGFWSLIYLYRSTGWMFATCSACCRVQER